jgi:hypothetical protein
VNMYFNPIANTKKHAIFNLFMENDKTKILIQLWFRR